MVGMVHTFCRYSGRHLERHLAMTKARLLRWLKHRRADQQGKAIASGRKSRLYFRGRLFWAFTLPFVLHS